MKRSGSRRDLPRRTHVMGGWLGGVHICRRCGTHFLKGKKARATRLLSETHVLAHGAYGRVRILHVVCSRTEPLRGEWFCNLLHREINAPNNKWLLEVQQCTRCSSGYMKNKSWGGSYSWHATRPTWWPVHLETEKCAEHAAEMDILYTWHKAIGLTWLITFDPMHLAVYVYAKAKVTSRMHTPIIIQDTNSRIMS